MKNFIALFKMQQKGSNFPVSPVKSIVPKNGLPAMIAAKDQNGSVINRCKKFNSVATNNIKLSEKDSPSLTLKVCKDILYPSDSYIANYTVHILQSSPKSKKLHIPIQNELSVEVLLSPCQN